jgi:hypothetical protein
VSHLGVYGITQSGKSWYVKNKLIPSCQRVLVLDVNSEYSRHSRTPGPLMDQGTAAQLAQHPRKLLEPNLSLAVEPAKPMPKQEAALLDLISRLLIAASRDPAARDLPPLTLVLDECGDYAPHCSEQLASLATRGLTHLNVRLVVIAQRPNLVPATVRGNLGELVCFKLVEPLDRKAVQERADKAFAERVSRLELRKHIIWRATGPTEQPDPPSPTRAAVQEQVTT